MFLYEGVLCIYRRLGRILLPSHTQTQTRTHTHTYTYICTHTHTQSDMGSSGAGGMDKHFTTFMKARIYCQLKLPTGREFAGAIDYQYNEISKSCDIM